MNTEKITDSNNTERTTLEGGSKEALNQKTSVQFILSTSLGVLTIILVAASAYYGLIRF
ncbi:hypothetical protein GNF10_12085 [Nostoc sp. UCD121]|uniref:hypothetical protein n=1 Tax=unclassified Nostoc TaxID=2593658 RepID=UPI00162A855A|nr:MULTISPECIES: hypothetical protein [unclassified Nostoc]MBC1220113.1 hypothetical protein [Nostoc sp. UCD120]MBC1276704.1 hypothetical protein [Nostoc sp. UCD121]MBC1298741.1 hypothetical protein [Nostoc sp. UCD122]